MSKRSPNFWSVGDQAKVPDKVVHFLGGGVAVCPAQVGLIVSVSPLKLRVDLTPHDSREDIKEVHYAWDELEEV